MSTIGIIAELNPPHTGHQFLFDSLKALEYENIVLVLSGCFVQRGEAAIFSKWARAKWALHMGADLVVSLPVVHSVSCAERFAKSAVSILSEMGVDAIGFGSEAGSIQELRNQISMLDNFENSTKLSKFLSEGYSLAAARARLLEDTVLSPNNILAMEYIRAIEQQERKIEAVTIARMGVNHDSLELSESFASASMIRKSIFGNAYDDVKKFISPKIEKFVSDEISSGRILNLDTIDTISLAKWRIMTISEISQLPEVSEGLEHRFKTIISKSFTMEQALNGIKTKRYTMARLKRIFTAGLLGISDDLQKKSPEYAHILGMSKKGESLLKNCGLPVSTSLLELGKISETAKKFVEIETRAGDIYTMSMKNRDICGRDFTIPVAKIL